MTRLATALVLLCFWTAAPASAQSEQEIGQMRLYIQQLEERVRQLTGQNEQLSYHLNQLRTQLGQAAPSAAATGGFAVPPAGSVAPPPTASVGSGAPPQDIGSLSVAPDDPLIAPDGAGAPVDLSDLAGGQTGTGGFEIPGQPSDSFGHSGVGAGVADPAAPAQTAALSGTPKDEYDLAYGYILTGEYGLAEQSFQTWLANFPDAPQAADARFWLGESQFQQGEYRDAANTFLAVYKAGETGPKAPEALLKLGMSLSALGEKNAACATFSEVERRFAETSATLMSRLDAEAERGGC